MLPNVQLSLQEAGAPAWSPILLDQSLAPYFLAQIDSVKYALEVLFTCQLGNTILWNRRMMDVHDLQQVLSELWNHECHHDGSDS
jgi:hypothetical protein